MYQDPKDVPMPEPTVKYGEYAGPPGEGAHCDLWDVDEMRAYAKDYAAAKCAALSARVAELEADAGRYRWLAGRNAPAHSARWGTWMLEKWGANGWTPLRGADLDAAIDAARANEIGKRTTSAAQASGREIPDADECSNKAVASGPSGVSNAAANGGDAQATSGGRPSGVKTCRLSGEAIPRPQCDDAARCLDVGFCRRHPSPTCGVGEVTRGE